jgi:hypothetical protein
VFRFALEQGKLKSWMICASPEEVQWPLLKLAVDASLAFRDTAERPSDAWGD